ncbi:ATP-binding protein [bacterium]
MSDKFIERHLDEIVFSDLFSRQMRFITGPRQCGKTTVAKHKLHLLDLDKFYYNWDRKEIRDRYRSKVDFLATDILDFKKTKKLWICFDEIHKMPKWKNILKDFFDTYEKEVQFIVTGSAKLDVLRQAGDSLAGRYFLFKLNPLMLTEVIGRKFSDILPEEKASDYIEKLLGNKKYEQQVLEDILKFSSFPEPLLQANSVFSKKWHDSYLERIVKEDLRDLAHIYQLEKVVDLLFLLPSKIGAPLSLNSLRQDLEVHHNTIKNYIRYFKMTYILFEVPPYSKKIKRTIQKEKKIYFYDFVVIENEAARFENFIALELKSRIDLWNDYTEDTYSLSFIRTRDGKETDFLILKNNEPYLMCEAKLANTTIEKHHYLHANRLGSIPFVQIVKEPKVLEVKQKGFYVVSACRFFS